MYRPTWPPHPVLTDFYLTNYFGCVLAFLYVQDGIKWSLCTTVINNSLHGQNQKSKLILLNCISFLNFQTRKSMCIDTTWNADFSCFAHPFTHLTFQKVGLGKHCTLQVQGQYSNPLQVGLWHWQWGLLLTYRQYKRIVSVNCGHQLHSLTDRTQWVKTKHCSLQS